MTTPDGLRFQRLALSFLVQLHRRDVDAGTAVLAQLDADEYEWTRVLLAVGEFTNDLLTVMHGGDQVEAVLTEALARLRREGKLMASAEMYRLLREHIIGALHQQKDYPTAVALAYRLHDDQFRVIANFDVGDDGEVDRYSLAYRVDVHVSDGWAPLCNVHWTRLGLSMDDVHREYASVAAQHEMGIAPSLDDPPPDPPSSNGEA